MRSSPPVALAAAGCPTTPPPAQAPDNTPTHPTAVIETHVSSSGLKGMSTQSASAAEKQRPQSSKSFLSGLGSLFSDGKGAENKGSDEPLFSMTYEIKGLKMENAHDGEFAVPEGYRRVQG